MQIGPHLAVWHNWHIWYWQVLIISHAGLLSFQQQASHTFREAHHQRALSTCDILQPPSMTLYFVCGPTPGRIELNAYESLPPSSFSSSSAIAMDTDRRIPVPSFPPCVRFWICYVTRLHLLLHLFHHPHLSLLLTLVVSLHLPFLLYVFWVSSMSLWKEWMSSSNDEDEENWVDQEKQPNAHTQQQQRWRSHSIVSTFRSRSFQFVPISFTSLSMQYDSCVWYIKMELEDPLL